MAKNSEQRSGPQAEAREPLRPAAALNLLLEVSRLLTEAFDVEESLDALLALCVPQIADFGAVLLREEEGLKHLALTGAAPEVVDRVRALLEWWQYEPSEETGFFAVLRSGKPEHVEDLEAWLEAHPERGGPARPFLDELGIGSSLAVPVVGRGRTLGLLALANRRPRRFDAATVDLAVEIGRLAGVALENAQLYAEARQTVQAREELLAVAAHELRTPLTSLQLRLSLLARLAVAVEPEGRLAGEAGSAARQAERLARLLDQLLDVGHIAAGGRTALHLEAVDLPALVEEVVDRFGEEAERAGCAIRVDAPPGTRVHGDRLRLEQILVNLLSNALKYGAGGPVEVSVRLEADEVCVVVRDRGMGFPREEAEHLFERHVRAPAARAHPGLGLGLYVVRHLVQAHGGRIRAEAPEGGGARFVAYLPAA